MANTGKALAFCPQAGHQDKLINSPGVNSGTTKVLTWDVYNCPGFLGRTERPEEGRHLAGRAGWHSRWGHQERGREMEHY